MGKGARIYKDFIDRLVKLSRKCASETAVKRGYLPWNDWYAPAVNEILSKLDQREREALGAFVLDAYHAGIHDTLADLEWMRCCKGMTITAEGETLPIGEYEGMHCDYVGRREDWEWPDV